MPDLKASNRHIARYINQQQPNQYVLILRHHVLLQIYYEQCRTLRTETLTTLDVTPFVCPLYRYVLNMTKERKHANVTPYRPRGYHLSLFVVEPSPSTCDAQDRRRVRQCGIRAIAAQARLVLLDQR